MPNDVKRAKFWIEIICSRCQYPAPEKLRAQFDAAELSDFCDCGCNSFGVKLSNSKVAPICLPSSRYGTYFEASFHTGDSGKDIDIILFSDAAGYLKFVEIDYCANAFPVPDEITLSDQPFFVWRNKLIIPQ